MKKLLSIIVVLFSLSAVAQMDVSSLAQSLIKNCSTDQQKVTAIFHWVTDNIAYTTFTKKQKRNSAFIADPEDDSPLKPLNQRVAEMVLKRGHAFCDGYARLFTALCEEAGIRSEIICGYANGGSGRTGTRFSVNHYWNAVFLDGQWRLADATWASGYINLRDGEFVKDYNGQYFLAKPESFIKDHYPDDPRWTLLPDDKVPDEFRSSPFKQRSFTKYGFTGFFPGRGIIEAFIGDTVVLELQAGKPAAGIISPSTLVDSSFFNHSASWVFLRPDSRSDAGTTLLRHQYTYPVTSTDVQWLYLVYNDDVVMRYKINVKAKQYN